MRCPTMSGPFQCKSELDASGKHAGSCEVTAEGSAPPGPAGDAARASASIRAILERAHGLGLDTMGNALGVERAASEPDDLYRKRIWSAR